jgi:hypothetical protein
MAIPGARVRRHRRSVTLIEAVLFLSVALGVIVGGLVFFQQASLAARTEESLRLVNVLVAEVRALNQRSGGALETGGVESLETLLIASGAVPPSAINADRTAIQTPWATEMTIQKRPLQGGAGTRCLRIELADVPPALCARITPFAESGAGRIGNGIYIMRFGRIRFYSETYGSIFGGRLREDEIGLDPGTAAALCHDGRDAIDIEISFSLH